MSDQKTDQAKPEIPEDVQELIDKLRKVFDARGVDMEVVVVGEEPADAESKVEDTKCSCGASDEDQKLFRELNAALLTVVPKITESSALFKPTGVIATLMCLLMEAKSPERDANLRDLVETAERIGKDSLNRAGLI